MNNVTSIRSARWTSIAIATALFAVAACGSDQEAPSENTGAGGPQQGGTLTIVQPAEPFNFDSRVDPKMEGIQVLMNVQDPLINFDPETGELVPGLAESWDVSSDGLEYTFELRQDVEFTDGTPFDAEDVIFTFEFLTGEREGGAYVSQFEPFIESVTATDPHTVVVTMAEPFTDFPELLARLWACRILSKDAVEAAGDDYGAETAVGTGPFMIEEWVKGDYVTMIRNPDYWGEPAYLDKVVYNRVPDGAARLVQARAGQADVVYQPPLDQLDEALDDPALSIESAAGNPIVFLRFNTAAEPFDNTDARRAVFHAIDRDQIRESAYGEYATTANDYIRPGHWAADPEYDGIETNTEKAVAALEAGGYDESNPLTFDLTMNNESEYTQLGTLIQAQLKEIGIEVNLRPLDPATLSELEATNPDEYDATVSRFILPTGVTDDYMSKQYAGDGVLNRTYLNQEGGLQLPELDNLIHEARVTQEQQEAKQLYREAVDMLVDNAVALPIAFKNNVNVVNKRVHDMHVQGTDAQLLSKVWVEE